MKSLRLPVVSAGACSNTSVGLNDRGLFVQSKSARTAVRNTVFLAGPHGALRLGQFCRGDQLHGLSSIKRGQREHTSRPMSRHTLVIFSMFRTDFNRSSISRRVAMFLAAAGAAPSTDGLARRPMVCRASIVQGVEGKCRGGCAGQCGRGRGGTAPDGVQTGRIPDILRTERRVSDNIGPSIDHARNLTDSLLIVDPSVDDILYNPSSRPR